MGPRWEFRENRESDLPQGVGKIRAMTDYEETHYGSPVGRRGGLAKPQSFGDGPDQVRKEEWGEFLHCIVPPVEALIKRSPAPVIVAADPEVGGHFREIAGWKEIQPDGISENPDALSGGELHRRAYAYRAKAGRCPGRGGRSPQRIAPGGQGDNQARRDRQGRALRAGGHPGPGGRRPSFGMVR